MIVVQNIAVKKRIVNRRKKMDVLDEEGFPILFLDDDFVYENLVDEYGKEKADEIFRDMLAKTKKHNDEIVKKLEQKKDENQD